ARAADQRHLQGSPGLAVSRPPSPGRRGPDPGSVDRQRSGAADKNLRSDPRRAKTSHRREEAVGAHRARGRPGAGRGVAGPLAARLRAAFQTLFRRSALDRDLDDELRSYEDLLTDRKRAAGLDSSAARAAARREVGDTALVRADVHAARVGQAIETT